ncbi:hypothetical protein BC835DRAFT_1483604 [Cytidiella melzeri]|nr:hypothetical protein BC835DRAFT_1483604 [Cytidiella melzeri]
MSSKPSVIIFGGLNTCSRALASLLVPIDGEPLVSHLRIVDKYSVSPPTTYLGAEFPKVLNKPNVEYRQANLQIPTTVTSCFDPPDGQEPYSYVFDLTGEIQWDRTEQLVGADQIQINTTFNVARLLGLEAAQRKVKAYVRLTHPFYECKEKSKPSDPKAVKADGVHGVWWHETARMLGSIENLNAVILRTAMVYGPYVNYGMVISFITVAATYGYAKEPMKALWGPGIHATHTVHVDDVAGALFACAEWIARVGREQAFADAGEDLICLGDKKKLKEHHTNGLERLCDPAETIRMPAFNLEDSSDSTMTSLGNTFTSVFGTTFEYYNVLVNQMAKFKLEDMVEDINESHVSRWTEMITSSTPPVLNSPYSAYMDLYALKKHIITFPSAKISEVVGYQLRKPVITKELVQEIVDKARAEGNWPNCPPRSS